MSILIEENFTNTGVSPDNKVKDNFNVEVVFSNTGTVEVQRRLNGGNSFVTIETITQDTSKRGFEPEWGVDYRFNCTALNGSVNCRISKQ